MHLSVALSALCASMSCLPIAGAQQSRTSTAKYDALPTGAPPSPFKSLIYENFNVVRADSTDLTTSSSPNILHGTLPFYANIRVSDSNATAARIRSFDLACYGQINGSPSTGSNVRPCGVTITSSFFIPAINIVTNTVTFTPNYSDPNGGHLQHYTFPADNMPWGSFFVFSLSSGGSVNSFYVDNLVYELV